MKIHEYQAKELLAAAGAAVPRGIVAAIAGRGASGLRPARRRRSCSRPRSTPAAAARAASRASGKDFGGVKFVTKRDDVGPVAEVMFKYPLVTKQTGEEGQKVSKVLVQEAGRHRPRGIYVGMVLDRAIGMPVLMACAEGGVEIEEVAARTPGEDPQGAGRSRAPACSRSRPAGWPSSWASPASRSPQAEKIMTALARVFLDKDCSLAEINPLVVTPNRRRAGARRQDDLRRQRPVPPSRHREAARPDRGEPGRAAGGQGRA